MAKMVAYKSQNIVKNCPFFYIWGYWKSRLRLTPDGELR